MNQKIYEVLIYAAQRKHILYTAHHEAIIRVADSSVCLAESTVI
jgi:hypothetical protein